MPDSESTTIEPLEFARAVVEISAKRVEKVMRKRWVRDYLTRIAVRHVFESGEPSTLPELVAAVRAFELYGVRATATESAVAMHALSLRNDKILPWDRVTAVVCPQPDKWKALRFINRAQRVCVGRSRGFDGNLGSLKTLYLSLAGFGTVLDYADTVSFNMRLDTLLCRLQMDEDTFYALRGVLESDGLLERSRKKHEPDYRLFAFRFMAAEYGHNNTRKFRESNTRKFRESNTRKFRECLDQSTEGSEDDPIDPQWEVLRSRERPAAPLDRIVKS